MARELNKRHYIAALSALLLIACAAFCPAAFAKCGARTIIQADGSTATFQAIVPDTKFAEFEASGYKEAACGQIDKQDYREKVCSPRSFGNRGVQRQLEVAAGVSFAQLCAAARIEAGLPETPPSEAQVQFSPSNRRPPVPKGGPGMVGRLGALSGGKTQIGGQ